VTLDRVQQRGQFEPGQHDHGGARGQRGAERDDEAHDVGERRQGQKPVPRSQRQAGGELPGRGGQVGVAEHDRLGQPGGAAGERQQGELPRFDGDAGRGQRATLGGQESRLGDQRPRLGDQGPGVGDQRRGAPVGRWRTSDVRGGFGLGGQRADAGDRAAGRHGAQRDRGPGGRVRRPQGQHVTGREPASRESGGDPVDLAGQRGVGDDSPGRGVNDGRVVR
jgi:hypothetical protein